MCLSRDGAVRPWLVFRSTFDSQLEHWLYDFIVVFLIRSGQMAAFRLLSSSPHMIVFSVDCVGR
jgi:hypothetical protein